MCLARLGDPASLHPRHLFTKKVGRSRFHDLSVAWHVSRVVIELKKPSAWHFPRNSGSGIFRSCWVQRPWVFIPDISKLDCNIFPSHQVLTLHLSCILYALEVDYILCTLDFSFRRQKLFIKNSCMIDRYKTRRFRGSSDMLLRSDSVYLPPYRLLAHLGE